MRLSRTTVGLAAALLVLPVVLVGTYAQKADRPAQDAEAPSRPNRQLRNSGMSKAARRPRDPNAPPWQPALVPATIPIRVAGVARDEAGKAVAGATITLYTITDKGSKPAGTATTDAAGRYIIRDAMLPVSSSFGGHPFPKEITPYASFILSGLAPGLGIAWSPQQSMYALKEPNPDDIQGRLPLASPVVLDLTFPKAAVLKGKVVDEDGQPVEGAKLQVMDCRPARRRRPRDEQPPGVRLEGPARYRRPRRHRSRRRLPHRGTCRPGMLLDQRESPRDRQRDLGLLRRDDRRPGHDPRAVAPRRLQRAGTARGQDQSDHDHLPEDPADRRHRGGRRHRQARRGAGVYTLGDSLAMGIGSGGTTDAAGKVLLGLPPGRYKGIVSDPPIETSYIRTYQRPLVVERGEGAQPYEIRQKAGVELIFRRSGSDRASRCADAFFWKAPEDQPEETQQIETSTFRSGEPWTDAKGELRAVLPPEPGRRYRFRFAGIHEPNMPSGINPATANKHGYEAFPTQSVPVELIAGKTIRLRFILRKTDQPVDRRGGEVGRGAGPDASQQPR